MKQELLSEIAAETSQDHLLDCITVVDTTASRHAIGKTFRMENGVLVKQTQGTLIDGKAKVFHIATAARLMELLQWVAIQPGRVVIAGAPIGTKAGDEINITTEDKFREMFKLGTAGKVDITSAQRDANGTLWAARKTSAWSSTNWVLLDADNPPGMPQEQRGWDLQQRLEYLESVLPGISKCERVEMASATHRVVNKGGALRPKASHGWVRLANGRADAVAALKAVLVVRCGIQGKYFECQNKANHQTPKFVIDEAVFVRGRVVFAGAPKLDASAASAGYVLTDANVRIVNEGSGALPNDTYPEPSDAELAALKAASGREMSISRTGGRYVFQEVLSNAEQLEVETATHGVLTVAEFRKLNHKQKVRCQTPFRESTSMAALMRVLDSGAVMIYDVGTNTTYIMPAPVDVSHFDVIPLAAHPETLTDADSRLAHEHQSDTDFCQIQKHLVNKLFDYEPVTGDAFNSKVFAEQWRGRLLYVHALKRWLYWDEGMWLEARGGAELRAGWLTAKSILSAATERSAQGQADPARKRALKDATDLATRSSRVLAMIDGAKAHEGMSVADPTVFDANHFEINCVNGVLDLRTKHLRVAKPQDMVSKRVSVSYKPDARCPHFLAFLTDVFNNDRELVDYMQRALGYCLTGSVKEEKLFNWIGGGSNGKSVLAGVIRKVLHDYQVTVSTALLRKNHFGNNSESDRQRFMLRGARVALMNEPAAGDEWDDGLLKELTSAEEAVNARQLYSEAFSFLPTHKLIVRTNNRPILKDTTDGTWRRLDMVPFTKRYFRAEDIEFGDAPLGAPIQDLGLAEKLASEVDGIFAWMVEGCVMWQQTGLRTPKAVADGTKDYRESSDILKAFLDDTFEQDKSPATTFRVHKQKFMTSYKEWCANYNFKPNSISSITKQLRAKGFELDAGKRYYTGLKLKDPLDLQGDHGFTWAAKEQELFIL